MNQLSILMGLCLFVLSAWFAPSRLQAQGTTRSTHAAAKGFPQYVDTGNPAQDQARYEAAKKQWTEQNPEAYRQLSGGNTSNQVLVHPDDFAKSSPERQAHIKANPQTYTVSPQAPKSEAPSAKETVTVSSISQAEFDKLSPERQAIIKANPDKYRIVASGTAANSTGVKDNRILVRREELRTMSPEKAKHIQDNSNMYKIVD